MPTHLSKTKKNNFVRVKHNSSTVNKSFLRMTGTPLSLIASKASPTMKSNYSEIHFKIFLFMY